MTKKHSLEGMPRSKKVWELLLQSRTINTASAWENMILCPETSQADKADTFTVI